MPLSASERPPDWRSRARDLRTTSGATQVLFSPHESCPIATRPAGLPIWPCHAFLLADPHSSSSHSGAPSLDPHKARVSDCTETAVGEPLPNDTAEHKLESVPVVDLPAVETRCLFHGVPLKMERSDVDVGAFDRPLQQRPISPDLLSRRDLGDVERRATAAIGHHANLSQQFVERERRLFALAVHPSGSVLRVA